MSPYCSVCGHSPLADKGITSEGRVWSCPQCKSLQLEVSVSIPNEQRDDYGAAYDEGMDKGKPDRLFQLFTQVLRCHGEQKFKTLLDVGCGKGAFLEIAQKNDWQVCGLDADSSAIASLRDGGISGICGTLGNVTAPIGQPFDVVTLWDVIEHVAELETAISWLASAVRPGGLIIVLTPDAESPLDRFAFWESCLTAGRSQRLMNLCLNRYHLRRFTVRGLITAFQRHGFAVEDHFALQIFSLKPERYMSGFAPGMRSWTPSAMLNRIASQFAYRLLLASGIKNKIVYVGRRLTDSNTEKDKKTFCKPAANQWNRLESKPSVVLLRPPTDRRRLFRCYSMLGSREAPLGLLYLGSHLKEHDIPVTILDGELRTRQHLLAALEQLRPTIVGITATTFSFFDTVRLLRRIRNLLPETLLLMGGPHVSALPEDSLRRIPELDGCIFGEGEETLLEIAQGKAPCDIAGLAWRDHSGAIQRNVARPFIEDLDRYKLHFELLSGYPLRYQPPMQSKLRNSSASLVASRGCGFACSFCAGSATHGHKRRSHSPSRVIEWMTELFVKFGVDDFYFHDDHFTHDLPWLEELCRLLIRSEKHFQWSCASRIEQLDSQLLEFMRRAGCWQIGVGIESGSEAVLNRISKRTSPQHLREGIRRIHLAGMSVKAYLILGAPQETVADIIQTMRFLTQNRVEDVQVCYFTPLPGSIAGRDGPVSPHLWPYTNLLTPLASSLPVGLLRAAEFSIYAQVYGRNIINLGREKIFRFR